MIDHQDPVPSLSEFVTLGTAETRKIMRDGGADRHSSPREELERIFGAGKRPNQHSPKVAQAAFARELVLQAGEISACVENLRDIAIYVRNFPFARAGISKHRYLRYHVEGYIQEVFLLRERLRRILTFVGRRYRTDSRGASIAVVIRELNRRVTEAFSVVTTARGVHVHEHRLYDDDLYRLELVEVLGRADPRYARMAAEMYRDVQVEKRNWIAKNNVVTFELADRCFRGLRAIVFTAGGRMRYPPAARGSQPRQK